MSASRLGRIRARLAELDLRTYAEDAPETHHTAPPRDEAPESARGAIIGPERPAAAIVTPTAFATALARQRARAGLSQARLGDMAGSNHSMVSRLESGSRNPSRAMVLRLADALHATPDDRAHLLAAAGYVSESPISDPTVAELAALLGDETVSVTTRQMLRASVDSALWLARARERQAA